MTAIKTAMREIQKREDMRWAIYTDAVYREQQRKPSNCKPDI